METSTASDPPHPTYADINDIFAHTSIPDNDPFKFSHGLDGVNQSMNYLLINILIATALLPVAIALCFRVVTAIRNDRRRISVITSCRGSGFWRKDRYSFWGAIKRHILYATIKAPRRHDKTKAHGPVNPATNPTRPQTLLITIYVLSNIAYCLAIPLLPRAQMVANFRGRCGALAAFNLIPTVLFALRNNPLIRILHLSYDTFNIFHRWTARLVVLESTAHVCAFLFNTYQVIHEGESGWHSVLWAFHHATSYQWGLAAFAAFVLLAIQSIGPLRHAFYETFLTLHRIGVGIAISGVYFHLAKHALPQLPWVYLVVALLALEPLLRTVRILLYNFSWRQRTWTHVTLEPLPGEATRVTLALPQSWNANPGSHVHVYLPRLSLWSSHPFSVAWSQSSGYAKLQTEKLPLTIDDLEIKRGPSTISCVIRARGGMTRSLYSLASRSESANVRLWGAIEGPYGGHHRFDSYGTVVLFAAGVGITHQLTFVRQLLGAHNNNTAATQKVLLVWCIANTEVVEWILPWLEELAVMPNFQDVVRIRIHVSKPVSLEEGRCLPAYLEVRPQRCDPQDIIDEEVITQVGAMSVSVCGSGAFTDTVREAVRRRVCMRSIDYFEEAFSY